MEVHVRKATKAEYEKLRILASQVVIECRGHMMYKAGKKDTCLLLTIPHGMKFKRGFPRGRYYKKADTYTIYKVAAWKILDWLHKNKLSPYDSTELVRKTKYFESFENQIDKMFNII